MQVTDMVSIMDTGIQDSILAGASRRRLLEAEGRKLLGFRDAAKRVGKSILTGLMRMLTGQRSVVFYFGEG